jgi:hypothetical protein
MLCARYILSRWTLRDIVRENNPVAKSGRNFFESLMLRFPIAVVSVARWLTLGVCMQLTGTTSMPRRKRRQCRLRIRSSSSP